MKRLNKQEKLFCRRYCEHFNTVRALREAGYDKATDSASLLGRPEIITEICRLIGLGREWVLLRAVELYKRCVEPKPVKKWDSSLKEFIDTGEEEFDAPNAMKVLKLINDLVCENGEGADSVTLIDDMEED